MGSRVFIKKDGVHNHRKFMKIPALLLLAERQSGKIQNDYVIILNYPALDFPHLQDNKVGFSKKNAVARYHIFLNIYHQSWFRDYNNQSVFDQTFAQFFESHPPPSNPSPPAHY